MPCRVRSASEVGALFGGVGRELGLSYLQANMGMILRRIDVFRTLEHKLLHILTRNVCCS